MTSLTVDARGRSHSSRVFLLILLLAAVLRLPGLDRVPPPLYLDEASRGYDAWSILETGADRHGRRWPFFLEGFGKGDYTAALTTYLDIPFIALLGPTVTAIRLPDALLGVATVALLFVWLKSNFGTRVALIASAMLATDPWHISLTRTGHETGFPPFFFAAALWAIDRAIPREQEAPARRLSRLVLAFFGGAMLALHAWSYAAPRLFTPFFCAAAAVIFRGPIRQMLRSPTARRRMIAAAAGICVGGIPLWITFLLHPEQLAARAGLALMDFRELGVLGSLFTMTGIFSTYLTPRYLFWQGQELTQIFFPLIGTHLHWTAPLLAVGAACVLANARRDRRMRLILAWFLLAHLPAVICNDFNPHPTRTICGMLVWPLLTGLGGDWLLARWAGVRWRRSLLAASAVLFLADVAFFAHQYFRVFPAMAELGHQTALIKSIQYAARHASPTDFILVTNRSNQPYIYALLFGPIPPRELAKDPPVFAHGPVAFHQGLRVGRFYFAPRDPVNYPDAQQLFEEAWRKLPPGAEGLVIEAPSCFAEGELLTTIHTSPNPIGDFCYEVRRWRIP